MSTLIDKSAIQYLINRFANCFFRKTPAGERLNTHCLYFFRMEKVESAWKINAIRKKVLLSDGNTAIHAGIVQK